MATDARIWPDIAIPPGEFLAETLEALGLTQADLAQRAGRPVQAVNEIVRGAKAITPETALQFEAVTGVPAYLWARLEADYRYNTARLAHEAQLAAEVPLAERYPYPAMARHGWVPPTRRRTERVSELRRFFGVSSLALVEQAYQVAFRKSAKVKILPEALAAWLRQGERQANQVETAPFEEARLRAALPALRALTTEPPEVFGPKLRERLAACGIALVFIPHLPGAGAHGATRRRTKGKALVQMSVRYRRDDIFWFSFFHELGHLLLHGRRGVFIETGEDAKDRREAEANAFAQDVLIPPAEYAGFRRRIGPPSRREIVGFAGAVGIAPSIVVGRLRHDGLLPRSNLNGLRARFQLVRKTRAGQVAA